MRGSTGRQVRAALSVGLSIILLAAILTPVAPASSAQEPTTPDTDNTVTYIQVYPNATAEWTVTIRTRLESEEDVEAYRAFQSRFRDNTSQYLDPFSERMLSVVARASEATDREMRATDFTATTTIQEVPRQWGVVRYRFTWTNFAATDEERLVVGDVFEGGFYLAADDSLEIGAPAGYEVTTVEPEPLEREEGTLRWIGREDFGDQRPQVVYGPASGSAWPAMVAGVGGTFLAGLVGLAAYLVWRRRDVGDENPEAGEPGGEPVEPSDTSSPMAANDSNGDEAVLTDEERVCALLKANGGRMRQSAIAEEFDWSASKTSRVVGRLVEKGSVEKLRQGRENLIDTTDE